MSTPDDDLTGATAENPTSETRAERAGRAARPRLPIGDTLGRYQIQGVVGRGGMGVVLRAHDPELGRDVALKILSRDPRDDDDGRVDSRLMREAQALAKLAHPNVVAVYDVGTSKGHVYLATELIEGESLSRWLRARRHPWREVLAHFVPAGRGLAAAHAAGLVHRDFKPSNVIVGNDGRVRVIDFGLARASASTPTASESVHSFDSLDTDASDHELEREPESGVSNDLLASALTHAGAIMGTPPYMAPEQHQGEVCDARADQFAFCVSLYYGLFGERPFAGRRVDELKANVLAGRVRPPHPDAAVPRWLHRVVRRGLAVDPAARWPSMDALLDALGRDPARRWRRAGTGALVVFAATLGVVGLWRGQRGAAPPSPCRDAGAPLAELWSAARRQALGAAFDASGHPHAREAFAGLALALDESARRWTLMRTEACEATHVDGTQSEALLDLRMQCLERRRVDLAARLDVLVRADRAVVQGVLEQTPGAANLEECADAETLRAAERLPEDPVARARVTELRAVLAKADALGQTGRYADAVPLVAQVIAGAEALRYRPLVAEAYLARADVEEYLGDYDAARADYTKAARAALAGRRDDLAADAWTNLVWLLGVRDSRAAEAHEWARYAEAALERVPARPRLRLQLQRAEVAVYTGEKRWPAAQALAQATLDEWLRLDPNDSAIGNVTTDLGDIARDQGHSAVALAHYQRALALYERVLGADHPHLATVLNNLGMVLLDQGRWPEAMAAYERALAIADLRLGRDHPTVANLRTNLGVLLAGIGRPLEALAQYDLVYAIDVAADPEGVNVAIDRINRAEALVSAGRAAEGLVDAGRAVAALRPLEGVGELLASALAAEGQALTSLGRPAEALVRHREATARFEATLGPTHPMLATALLGEGEALLALHRPGEAVAPLMRAFILRLQTPLARAPLAAVEFALARACWAASGGDRVAALQLGRLAAADFAATADSLAPRAAAAEAWVAAPGRP